ncbi:MAG TPA: matrixin family metalloprotease [Pyrinomonadaceae bacterium]|nr:matrixin family metalloprotease [Pyrinomonadaceae bacterium]
MQYPLSLFVLMVLLTGFGSPGRFETRDYSELEPTTQIVRQIKWPSRTIDVAFSTSLQSPGSNIKPGSDVVGAARRALARWSAIANINFVVGWSSTTSVSPASAGDGVSLITVADTAENQAFNADSTSGRTRVFYDPETGAIAEADVSINPRPKTEEGADLQFSTDGSPGTYDLEATFTHEIGHLLGLDHSAVLGATMQGRQAFNGTFGLPALTERTLSEDDRQRVRSLYGPKQRLGRIEGRLIDNRLPNTSAPLNGVNVWAESVATGRVVASGITNDDGSYKFEGLVPGQYRVVVEPREESGQRFRSFEISNQVFVKADAATSLNYNLVPPQASLPALNPRLIGLNGELSTVGLPLEAGKKFKIYLAGEGIDQVPGSSIAVNSPYFTIEPSSLAREQMGTPFPVVSFDITAAPNVPFGDYSIKLQSNSGETAFLPGALTIDPGVSATGTNPIDDYRFFITQHYLDLTGREPDQTTLEKLTAQFTQCGSRVDCLKIRRLDLAASLLAQNELPSTGVFLHSLYTAGFGRRPHLSEYESDRNALSTYNTDIEDGRVAFALSFVQRAEFQRRYPTTLRASEFVDQLLGNVLQHTGIDLKTERTKLIGLYDGTNAGRAAVLSRVVSPASVIDAQYNQAFVLLQYFGYLRRDPDESGFNFWVNVLKSKPLRDPSAARSMVCAFLTSTEYQNRFGMLTTHSTGECGN